MKLEDIDDTNNTWYAEDSELKSVCFGIVRKGTQLKVETAGTG